MLNHRDLPRKGQKKKTCLATILACARYVSVMSVQLFLLYCCHKMALTSSFDKFCVFTLCGVRISCDGFSSVYFDDGIN